jgi:hypothetical protein
MKGTAAIGCETGVDENGKHEQHDITGDNEPDEVIAVS